MCVEGAGCIDCLGRSRNRDRGDTDDAPLPALDVHDEGSRVCVCMCGRAYVGSGSGEGSIERSRPA